MHRLAIALTPSEGSKAHNALVGNASFALPALRAKLDVVKAMQRSLLESNLSKKQVDLMRELEATRASGAQALEYYRFASELLGDKDLLDAAKAAGNAKKPDKLTKDKKLVDQISARLSQLAIMEYERSFGVDIQIK